MIGSQAPLVMIVDSLRHGDLCDTVGLDNRAGIRLAVRHLVQAGHREIAYLSMCDLPHRDMPDRLDGYRDGMQAHGLELTDDLIIEDTNWPWHRPGAS